MIFKIVVGIFWILFWMGSLEFIMFSMFGN